MRKLIHVLLRIIFIIIKIIKNNFYYNKSLSFYSDVVRYLLLYNYGGVWFDLDCFILRNFDPIFSNFENEICVYQWENQYYPNGAIYISLEPNSLKMNLLLNATVVGDFKKHNLHMIYH